MDIDTYWNLYLKVKDAGYSEELEWADNIKECDNAIDFAIEAVWVILCSGFKEQAARPIMNKILTGECIMDVVRHPLKAEAICYICSNRYNLFRMYQDANDKLEYLKSLPHIGEITKYHLAKNLGLDVVKPDRHLVRIAKVYNMTPLEMCEKIRNITGDKLSFIDSVIWRAANLGFI